MYLLRSGAQGAVLSCTGVQRRSATELLTLAVLLGRDTNIAKRITAGRRGSVAEGRRGCRLSKYWSQSLTVRDLEIPFLDVSASLRLSTSTSSNHPIPHLADSNFETLTLHLSPFSFVATPGLRNLTLRLKGYRSHPA